MTTQKFRRYYPDNLQHLSDDDVAAIQEDMRRLACIVTRHCAKHDTITVNPTNQTKQ